MGLCVCPVDCEKLPERIRIPFGMVGREGPWMKQVLGFGDRSTGRGIFRGRYGAPHCNQWGTFYYKKNSHCAAARLLLGEFLELQARRARDVASTPSNAMLAWYKLLSCVCLSVSVTRRYCIETAKWIKLFLYGGFLRPILHCVVRKFE